MKNRYEIRGDHTIVYVDSSKYGTLECIIDTDDLGRIPSSVYVKPNSRGILYAIVTVSIEGKKKKTLLHRFLMNPPEGYIVDHRDRSTLNNRRDNLRTVTVAENNQNKSAQKNNKSTGVRGLTYNPRCKNRPWEAKLNHLKKVVFRAYYATKEEATQALDEARAKYMPYNTYMST